MYNTFSILVLFIGILGGEAQNDLEARVAKLEEETRKLEELVKMGTLRSCAEYSQYGIKCFATLLQVRIQPPFQTDYITF